MSIYVQRKMAEKDAKTTRRQKSRRKRTWEEGEELMKTSSPEEVLRLLCEEFEKDEAVSRVRRYQKIVLDSVKWLLDHPRNPSDTSSTDPIGNLLQLLCTSSSFGSVLTDGVKELVLVLLEKRGEVGDHCKMMMEEAMDQIEIEVLKECWDIWSIVRRFPSWDKTKTFSDVLDVEPQLRQKLASKLGDKLLPRLESKLIWDFAVHRLSKCSLACSLNATLFLTCREFREIILYTENRTDSLVRAWKLIHHRFRYMDSSYSMSNNYRQEMDFRITITMQVLLDALGTKLHPDLRYDMLSLFRIVPAGGLDDSWVVNARVIRPIVVRQVQFWESQLDAVMQSPGMLLSSKYHIIPCGLVWIWVFGRKDPALNQTVFRVYNKFMHVVPDDELWLRVFLEDVPLLLMEVLLAFYASDQLVDEQVRTRVVSIIKRLAAPANGFTYLRSQGCSDVDFLIEREGSEEGLENVAEVAILSLIRRGRNFGQPTRKSHRSSRLPAIANKIDHVNATLVATVCDTFPPRLRQITLRKRILDLLVAGQRRYQAQDPEEPFSPFAWIWFFMADPNLQLPPDLDRNRIIDHCMDFLSATSWKSLRFVCPKRNASQLLRWLDALRLSRPITDRKYEELWERAVDGFVRDGAYREAAYLDKTLPSLLSSCVGYLRINPRADYKLDMERLFLRRLGVSFDTLNVMLAFCTVGCVPRLAAKINRSAFLPIDLIRRLWMFLRFPAGCFLFNEDGESVQLDDSDGELSDDEDGATEVGNFWRTDGYTSYDPPPGDEDADGVETFWYEEEISNDGFW